MPATFPLNAWYAAAWDVDVKQALFPRTICGKHVVMYRKADGQVTALEDACWHRLVPLSKGRLDGDTVVCGYHGLKYNAQGRCTFMPSQETINPSACVRAYPVVERHRFIWLWMGDPALADPALVPDMHWNDDPAWAGDGKTIHVEVRLPPRGRQSDGPHPRDLRARLLHRQRRTSPKRPFDVTHGDKTVDRDALDARHRGAAVLGQATAASRARSTAGRSSTSRRPCTVDIDVGVAPAGTGAPEGDRSQGVNGFVLNTMTPETDTTCHYFWAFVRNYRHHRAEADHRDPRGRFRHLPRGRAHPRGAAARDGRKSGPHLLQPQHRRRRDVGAARDRPDGGAREPRRRPSRPRSKTMSERDSRALRLADRAGAARAARHDPVRRGCGRASASPSCRRSRSRASRARRCGWRWCGWRTRACWRRSPPAASW